MYDAIVLSDLHLGSDNCQAKSLADLLERIRAGTIDTGRIILNGDVFDSIDFRRLKKHHWKVLSLLRKMSDELTIDWIHGNHDGPAEFISPLLGLEVSEELVIESGRRKILFHHGHRFDSFIDRHPIITAIADTGYRILQRLDRSHSVARLAKAKSKTFLRCAAQIESKSREYAIKISVDAVACGHTHHALAHEDGPIAYYNSGCWTEKPCTYLTVRDGDVRVTAYAEEPAMVDRFAPVLQSA